MFRKIILFVLLVTLLLSNWVTASAEVFDYNCLGSITLKLLYDEEEPIVGAEFDVYYVADVGINTDNKINYIYSDAFKKCGIDLEDTDLAAKLSAYVDEKQIKAEKIITDSSGFAKINNLPLGLYLLKQVNEVEGFSQCTPFLVTVPFQNGLDFIYDIGAVPKTDIIRLATVNIKAVWNDAKTPVQSMQRAVDSRTLKVELYRNNSLVETAMLHERNNWQVSYPNMPASDTYSVKASEVPQGYTVTYKQQGYDFTIILTPALAQTGQLIWPIPVLAACGLFFLKLGFVILRKSGKKDA